MNTLVKIFFIFFLLVTSYAVYASHVSDTTQLTIRGGVNKAICHVSSNDLDNAIAFAPVREDGVKLVSLECLNTVKIGADDAWAQEVREHVSE